MTDMPFVVNDGLVLWWQGNLFFRICRGGKECLFWTLRQRITGMT